MEGRRNIEYEKFSNISYMQLTCSVYQVDVEASARERTHYFKQHGTTAAQLFNVFL